MKVHILCPVFPPESVTSAVMAEHIAEGLGQSGADVTVITSFPTKMKGELFAGYRRTGVQFTRGEHYQLCRVFTLFSRESTIFSRARENFSYAIASNLASILLGRPDLIYMNTWPAVSTFITALVCVLRHVPYIYNVQDLYPESAAGLGLISPSGRLYRVLTWMDRFTMQHAAHVIPISEEFAQQILVTRRIEPTKLTVVWNWYDGCVRPEAQSDSLRARFTTDPNSFVVMYAGNIGSVAGLEVVLEAAEVLANRGGFHFVLAGDGARRACLEEQRNKHKLANVHFFYPLHREQLAMVQAAADVLLITTRPGLALSEVPSKLMAYMLSGRPVLAMVEADSNTAQLIRRADCGLVATPGDPIALANCVEAMSVSPLLRQWANNARSFAVDYFTPASRVPIIVNLAIGSARTSCR